MDIRKAIIPYHFGIPLDLRRVIEGDDHWCEISDPIISDRLSALGDHSPQLVVSGDCMAAIGAHQDGLGLVWYDAHGDFHTLATTITGNLGGMPLAMLCGIGDLTLLDCCGVNPIQTRHVYHVGGTEFDAGEQRNMLNAGITVVRELWGIKPDSQKFPPRIHLHIDTDVVTSKQVSSAFHPAPNGVIVDLLLKQLDLLWPITEVLSIKTHDPRKDGSGAGANLLNTLIRRFCERTTH